ncbi:phosphoadenylyl-sulfate reductase, partial [bacterium]|nr:phosphoadenylyl-sulfate reductase [bacterium]
MMSIQSRFGGAPEYTDDVASKAEATVATLRKIAAEHTATVANSYGAEDMVLMDLI